jgi:hypothetical protein
MTDRQSTEPSAFSQFLATNQSIAPDYVVRGPDGDAIAAKWHRPASRTGMHSASAQHTLMYHVGGSTSVAKFVEGRCVGTRSQHGSLTFSPELKRANVTYEELARRLRDDHGLDETAASIGNKLSRGTFAATFFLATMKAIGREHVNLSDV